MANITSSPVDSNWIEPESPANQDEKPVYPHNKVWETESGHSFEMDDTKDRERIRLQHRSKTFFEMHPNGDKVDKVYGDRYEITYGRDNVLIKGTCNITIEGDCNINIKGDKVEKIEGDYYQEIGGRLISNIKGTTDILSNGDMNIGVGDPVSGVMTIRVGDYVYVQSDMSVTGALTAASMTSDTKVNAGTGVTAGPLGFVTESGGLSVGLPISSPIGVINSSLSVNAPFINGFMVSDIAGSMMGMRFTYNTHIHPAPRGLTGTPISPMTLL